MPDPDSDHTDRLGRLLARGKDLVAILRDGSLLLLAILLIAFPSVLNDILVRAGFEEGSVVGFKWKARLVQSDETLKTAQATIASLQEQLDKTREALAATNAAVPDGGLRDKLQSLEKESREVSTAAAAAQSAVRSTIDSNAPLVERAQSAAGAPGRWGVVLGSDTSLAAAKVETERAAKAGIKDAAVYLRNGYYASIAVVDDRERASDYLLLARKFRRDAYVTPMASWCRDMQPREGFTECKNTR